MLPTRLAKLSASLPELPASGRLALNPSPSLIYLTGLHFHLMERPTVAFFTADSPPVLVLPELEMLKVKDLPFEVKAFPLRGGPGRLGSGLPGSRPVAGVGGQTHRRRTAAHAHPGIYAK